MRNIVIQSLIQFNYELLAHNPISSSCYSLLLLIQVLIILFFPFFTFFYVGYKYTSIIRVVYELEKSRDTMITVITAILAQQIVTLLFYLIGWSQEFYKIRNRKRKILGEESNNRISQNQKVIFQLTMVLFIFNSKLISIPARTFALRSIIQTSIDNTFNITLFSLSIALMFVDFAISLVFNMLLQTIFPMQKVVPWASSEPSYQIVQELLIYMFSILTALPQNSSYSFYVYMTFAPFAAALSIYLKTPYSNFIFSIQSLNQSSIISACIIMSISLQRLRFPRSQYAVTTILIIIMVYLFIKAYSDVRKRRLLLLNENISTTNLAVKWIWAFESSNTIHEDSSVQTLNKIITNCESILTNHSWNCIDDLCHCKKGSTLKLLVKNRKSQDCYKNCQKLKLIILEIFLGQLLVSTDQEVVLSKQNDLVGLLLVYYWSKINKNYLSCAYNLIKFHDCSKCNLNQCFQFYSLKRIIQSEIQQKQNQDDGQISFQKMIYFEQNFKHYSKIIENTIYKVNDYWQMVLKNQLDILKAEVFAKQILTSYRNFIKIYNFLNRECGDIMIIESLAWRIHQEVLNFEYEANQNLEKIKQIMTKQRFQNTNNNEYSTMSQFNFKSCFIIIGANPKNFQQILSVSKSLVKSTGFSEDFLTSSSLKVLLPSTFVDFHEKYIKDYLKRKNGTLSKVVVPQQWMKKLGGTLKPINIYVMPKYDFKEGLRLIGVIQPIKKFEIFEQQINSNMIFGIFCDTSFRINHVTENCLEQLQFHQDILAQEIYLDQIVTNLPEDLKDDYTFITDIDLTRCYSFEFIEKCEKNKSNQKAKFKIKVYYRQRVFENQNMSREFLFIILGESNEQNQITFGYENNNISVITPILTIDESHLGPLKASASSESHSIDLQSISSASSASSSVNSQDTQINNIKCTIEFKKLPSSLMKYRLWLIIGFLTLMAMGFLLLGINLYAKDQFLIDLNALQTEKKLRNNFASAKLVLISLFTSQNLPTGYNTTQNIALQTLNKKGIGKFYQENLVDVIQRLQVALVSFAQSQNSWDESFVAKMNTDLLQLKFVTTEGNFLNLNQSFYKSITLYLDYLDYLSNSNMNDFNMSFSIFDMNTETDYQMGIQQATAKQKTILQYIYYIFFNGSEILLDKIYEIDKYFVGQLLVNGNNLIRMILIIAVCCASMGFLLCAFYIPYFLSVEQLNEKIIKFIYKTDKSIIISILEMSGEFKEFIDRNKFLQNNANEGNHKNHGKHYQSVKSSHQFQSIQIERPIDQNEEFKEIDHLNNPKMLYQPSQDISKKDSDKSIYELRTLKFQNNKFEVNSFTKPPAASINKSLHKKQKKNMKRKLQNEILEENSDNEDDDNNNKQEYEDDQENPKIMQIQLNQDHGMTIDFQKISQQSQKRKLLAIGLFFIVGITIALFFISVYFLSKQLFESYQQGFFQFDIFYLRNTCTTESHFLLQKSIMLNQSVEEISYNGQQFKRQYDECTMNEGKYRDMKKDSTGIFSSIIDILQELDSNKMCDFLIKNKAAGKECFTDAGGVITLGLEQLMQYLLSDLNQQKINYGNSNSIKTEKGLQTLFFQKGIITNIGIYYSYMQWIFRYVQTSAKSILDNKMSENFVQIIAIYSVFEVVVLLMAVLCIYRLVSTIKHKLHQIRFMLKLLPANEILKNKNFLDKLNTKLL